MKINEIKTNAENLRTTIGALNMVSYDEFNISVGDLTQEQFIIVTTAFVANRSKYESERMF